MIKNLIFVFVLSALIVSCNSNPEQTPEQTPDSELIGITKAQFEGEKMEMGAPLLTPFSELVSVTGTIIPGTNGQAQISLPWPGIIAKIYVKPGQIVTSGTAMFAISGNDFIDLQKDFAESSAIVSRLKSDYLRAKDLFDENIATQKEFAYAQSIYFAENAKYNALKIKLENLGLAIGKIETGEFYASYTVKAPISGFVSGIEVTIGQYIEPQQNIAEVIDAKSFQLKLSVFQENSHKIKAGQQVSFYLNGNKSVKYLATIYAVGKNIVPELKSVACYATIENPDAINLVNNQFIEGDVFSAVDSVLAVPQEAIINSDNDAYLLMYEKEENAIYYFKKFKVSTGRINNNYVELTGQLPTGKLLIKGLYNLQME